MAPQLSSEPEQRAAGFVQGRRRGWGVGERAGPGRAQLGKVRTPQPARQGVGGGECQMQGPASLRREACSAAAAWPPTPGIWQPQWGGNP